ncbi:MAG: MBL fold metallo-hydrolase RNA specificity domain-containing protein [Candidatus Zhuqueibacterota bacterium]
MFYVDKYGVRIFDSSFWLDAQRKVPLSFVSHAHSDHVKPHNEIIATPATISLVQLRNSKLNGRPLPYHQKLDLDDFTIELFPSGHILGSAQILIRKNGASLLYSGDFRQGESLTAEAMEFTRADILIMESTFGDPKFVFPKRWMIIERLVKFIDKCFHHGVVPVIMGYAIGKAQEIIKILINLDYQVSVHATIAPILKVYEQYGIDFKNYQVYQGEDLRGRVLVIPPHLSRSHLIEKIWKSKKLILTGWAASPDARYRYHADEALPFSDHADFEQLIEYVHRVQPQQVFVTHGDNNFIQHLRREGFQASPLKETNQMTLF